MATKTKQPAPKVVTLKEATEAAADYLTARIQLDNIENNISRQVSAIRSKYTESIGINSDILYEADQVMRAFAEQDRDNWEGKSLDLTHCRIGFRAGSRKVCLATDVTDKEAIAVIKANKPMAKKFIVTTESLDKKAVLACKDEADIKWLQNDAGVYVDRDADKFYVEPKKEEVTA